MAKGNNMKYLILISLIALFSCGKKKTTTTTCENNFHYNGYRCVEVVENGVQTDNTEKTIVEKCAEFIKEKNRKYELCVNDFINDQAIKEADQNKKQALL